MNAVNQTDYKIMKLRVPTNSTTDINDMLHIIHTIEMNNSECNLVNYLNWEELSKLELSDKFIIRFNKHIKWDIFSKKIALTEERFVRYIAYIKIESIIYNPTFNPQWLNKYKHKVGAHVEELIVKQKLDEDVLNVLLENYDVSLICRTQELTDILYIKYWDSLDWKELFTYQFNINNYIIERFFNDMRIKNKKKLIAQLTICQRLDIKLVERYFDEFDLLLLMRHQQFDINELVDFIIKRSKIIADMVYSYGEDEVLSAFYDSYNINPDHQEDIKAFCSSPLTLFKHFQNRAEDNMRLCFASIVLSTSALNKIKKQKQFNKFLNQLTK